jgi:hypothetical protein
MGQLVERIEENDVEVVRDFSNCVDEVIRCLEERVLPKVNFRESVIEEAGGNPRRFASFFMEFWWSAVVVLFGLISLRNLISSKQAEADFRRVWRRWKLFLSDIEERFKWSIGLYWGRERIGAKSLSDFIDRYPFKHIWKGIWGRGSSCVVCAFDWIPEDRPFPLLDYSAYMDMLNSLRNGGGRI